MIVHDVWLSDILGIFDDLRQWNAVHRIPILYVTHSHREVFALGERVVVQLDALRGDTTRERQELTAAVIRARSSLDEYFRILKKNALRVSSFWPVRFGMRTWIKFPKNASRRSASLRLEILIEKC